MPNEPRQTETTTAEGANAQGSIEESDREQKGDAQSKPSRPQEETANGAPPPAARQNPPQMMAELPSLGPIRIRALKKAGFGSLSALKTADVAALAAISGMTEIKAKQIHDYLSPFESLPETEPDALTKSAANGNGKHPASSEILDLQKVAAECMGLAIVLLANPPKDGWRGARRARNGVVCRTRCPCSYRGAYSAAPDPPTPDRFT